MPDGTAVASAENDNGTWTQMFWLTVKEHSRTGVPGHAPITGPPTQKDSISPTSTAGVIITSACTHTVSWTVAGHVIGAFGTAAKAATGVVKGLLPPQPQGFSIFKPPFNLNYFILYVEYAKLLHFYAVF